MTIPRSTSISNGVEFQNKNIVIGEHVFINRNCCLYTVGKNIADDCITIGRGCWIGIGAVILSGFTNNKGCIIGAGSVVNKDCEANCLYAGNPARLKRRLI